MLQTSFIRENAELLKTRLLKRNLGEEDLKLVDQAISLDDQRKAQQTELDSLLASRNQLSGEIGKLFKSGQREKAEEMRAQVGDLKEQAATLEAQLKDTLQQLQGILYSLPNMPHESVPAGNTDEDNEVFKAWSEELLADDDGESQQAAEKHWQTVLDKAEFDTWLGRLEEADLFAFDTETTSLNYMEAELVGLSVAIDIPAGKSIA